MAATRQQALLGRLRRRRCFPQPRRQHGGLAVACKRGVPSSGEKNWSGHPQGAQHPCTQHFPAHLAATPAAAAIAAAAAAAAGGERRLQPAAHPLHADVDCTTAAAGARWAASIRCERLPAAA